MKVAVTGASGFLGSHTIRALLDAGHQVRATARSIARIRQALAPHGCAADVEAVTADVTAPAPVRDALAGCDAVIHAAAVYSLDSRRQREMRTTNPRGTEVVLGQARELGLGAVHVSTYTALLPAAGPLTPDSPVGDPPVPYARSKAESERIARRWQDAGAPVTIVYPGMVWGPHDPAAGESTLLARAVLGRMIPFRVPGEVPVVDVRDVAAVLVAAVEAAVPAPAGSTGARRYLAAAEMVPMAGLQRMITAAAGRRPPRAPVPAPVLLAAGRIGALVQRVLPVRLPVSYEGPWSATHCPPVDASATTRDLGVAFRPAADTVRDTVRWLTDDRRPRVRR